LSKKDYVTITAEKESESVIKGSRFIGIASPVHDEGDLRSFISDVMRRYPEATHYCYGAVYGGSDLTERSSDNGEPSGTAGRPILNVIRQSSLSDTAVVVVRYFGGTLLGTGGLVHAYTSSASDVLTLCEKIRRMMCSKVRLRMGYQDIDRFRRYVSSYSVSDPVFDYAADVTVMMDVPLSEAVALMEKVTDVFGGRIVPEVIGQGYAP